MTKKRQPSLLITFSIKELPYLKEIEKLAAAEAETRDDPNFSKSRYVKRILINHAKKYITN